MNAPKRSTALGLRVATTLLFGVAVAASAQIPGLPPLVEKRADNPAASTTGSEPPSGKAESPETRSRVDQLIADFRANRDRPLPVPPEGVTGA